MIKWVYQNIDILTEGSNTWHKIEVSMFVNNVTGEIKFFNRDIVQRIGINNIELEPKKKGKDE